MLIPLATANSVLLLYWILALYLAFSLLTFAAYALDKHAAVKNRRRIPESSLHALELLGGWPGALLAQHLLRHKNRKLPYQLLFWPIVLLHLAAWSWFFLHRS